MNTYIIVIIIFIIIVSGYILVSNMKIQEEVQEIFVNQIQMEMIIIMLIKKDYHKI